MRTVSSHGRSRPSDAKCALKATGVLSEGMRTSLKAMSGLEEVEGPAFGGAEYEEGEFAGVVIAPHGAFAVGDSLAGVDVIPAVGPVIDGMEEESLVVGIGGEVGFGEQGAGDVRIRRNCPRLERRLSRRTVRHR